MGILADVKQVIGVSEGDTSFDVDVLMHINAALSALSQLGVGPANGVTITNDVSAWTVLALPANQLNLAKQYIILKVKGYFDPPSSGYHVDSHDRMVQELEWRLNVLREVALDG